MKTLATCLLIFALWEARAFSSGTVGQTTQEVVTKDIPATFTAKTNLVMVPVVVRDKKGKVVENLQKEDFQLFDKGKPQVISRFSVEKSGVGKATAGVGAPDRFVGLLFDDVHTNLAGLVRARTAAQKFVASSLKPTDRAAIFTTSGQTVLDFTDDRDLLNKTLAKLAVRPLGSLKEEHCPTIGVYQADQIINMNNSLLIAAAVAEVRSSQTRSGYQCYGPDLPYASAVAIVLSHARAVLEEVRHETNAAIVSLKDVVRRMAAMPGQRTLILASPGFIFTGDQFREEGPAIDLAIRFGVVINGLGVEGVGGGPGVLDDLASGTGGRALYGNDLTEELQELGTAPGVFYLLGFSPQNLRLDGAFHALKVSLKTTAGMSVQARTGYYAPDHLASAEEDAKEEVTQALFSRDEISDIPVETNTEFFKASESEARLSVTSRIDIRKLRFGKADGRNFDDIRVVCALFDRNGVFVQAVAKIVQMRLLDDTLQNNKLSGGIPVSADFAVTPGTYLIRLVVRDAEGQTMTAQNSAVKIP